MRNAALSLYASRKEGRGQSLAWRMRNALASLLLVFISLALSFALIFINSMAQGLDRTLQLLGSGSLHSDLEIPSSLLEGARVDCVRHSSGLAYSETGSALVTIKAVEDDYFFPQRSEAMGLESVENTTSLHSVVISRIMGHELGLEAGDRLAMMIYDEELGRVRPVFLFIEGTYSTGYGEFDSNLVFTDSTVVTASPEYEILTEDPDTLASRLRSEGFPVTDYRNMYRGIYQNIRLSVSLLDVIVVLIAFLAGFFALSMAAEYIERDRRDIALMSLIGVERKQMARCYVRITLVRVAFSLALGFILGLILSFILIPLLGSLDTWSLPALQSYVTNFEIAIPFATLALTALALMLSAWLSLEFSMKRTLSSLWGALAS